MTVIGARDSVIGSLLALVVAVLPLGAQPKPARVQVAARPLERGAVLTADDIAMQPLDSVRGPRVPSPESRSPVVGWVTRRVIAAGEVLREPAVAPPNAIQSGDKVAVVWRDAGIEVRLNGTATNAAPLGGHVTVHVDVRRRLEGVVVAPGLVQIR